MVSLQQWELQQHGLFMTVLTYYCLHLLTEGCIVSYWVGIGRCEFIKGILHPQHILHLIQTLEEFEKES
jgi:hypothetical protein